MTTPPLLQAQHLVFQTNRHVLINDVSLEVSSGEIVTIVGPNGAGKTTLLRLLLGLLTPSSGTLVRRPKLRIGYLPQKLAVDPVLPLSVYRMMTLTRKHSRPEVREALEVTGIGDLLNEPVQTLSGGEFQRMMLSRALLQHPELLVLDEPVQGVDYMGEAELYRLIGRLRAERGCGILMVSHDLHVVMASTDRVVCLNQHICCEGQPHDVTRHPEYVRLFGAESGAALAVYQHHHDHTHDACGHPHPLPAEEA